MFSLHERTQRKVCRTAFVMLCAVPTVVTLCWVTYFYRPWHERDWQQALESELHVRVTVDEVSAPRPLERAITTVRFADLQLQTQLAEIDRLCIAGATSLSAESLSINCMQLKQVAQAVQVWFGSKSFQPLHCQVNQLILRADNGKTCRLEKLRCEAQVSASDSRLCLIQAIYAGNKVQLLVERTKEGKVHVKLDTPAASLPTWLLTEVVPGANRWEQAEFAGVLELEREHTSATGNFCGEVRGVDTRAWIGTTDLQATANLKFDKLQWRDGRFEAIQGSLAAAEGNISNPLLQTLNTKLRCPLSSAPAVGGVDGFQEFDQLGCRFQLNAEGLTVSGTFPIDSKQWAIAIVDGKPLVLQPTFSRLPLAFLIETICTPADFTIPATRSATDLADKLPLPESDTQKK
jgi:hypothetical protein